MGQVSKGNRRWIAFCESKVLNALIMIVVTSCLLMGWSGRIQLPAICCIIAFSFFLGYSIWYWLKKPEGVLINKWLSNISAGFTLYYILIISVKAPNQWWYITPICFAVVVLCYSLICNKDEMYNITEKK